MFLVTRFFPFFAFLLVVGGFEFSLSHPALYIAIVSLMVLLSTVAVIFLLRRNPDSERRTLLVPQALFLAAAGFAFAFLSSGGWLSHILIFLAGLSVWAYFEELYRYTYEPERYHQHAIEHLAGYLGIVAIAGFLAGIFALRIFLMVRLIFLMPITIVFAIAVSASIFAVQPLSRSSLWSSSVIFGILLTEMTLAVLFLPTHFWVDSLIITIPFYVTLHLVRHELNGTITTSLIRRYSLIGFFTICVVLLTAQWVL